MKNVLRVDVAGRGDEVRGNGAARELRSLYGEDSMLKGIGATEEFVFPVTR